MRVHSLSRLAALLVASVGLAATARAADAPDAPAPDSLTIGVAPFERRAAPEIVLPPIDQLLADRFATQGVREVVGPGQIGAKADAEPTSDDVKAWSSQAGVAALVVGRITRTGIPIGIELQLHSAATGEVLGSYAAEVLKPEQLDAVVDDLARQVLAGAGGTAPDSAPPVSTAPADGSDGAFGIGFDSSRPVSIRADQLESVRSSGARTLLFTQNVVVVQDDVTIHSNRLEAFYPPDASQPEKMVATGSVRMTSRKNEARCDRATYERSKDMLVCRGNAELREGGDCVAGEWIEFDLESETVRVGGGAKVVIGGSDAPTEGRCR